MTVRGYSAGTTRASNKSRCFLVPSGCIALGPDKAGAMPRTRSIQRLLQEFDDIRKVTSCSNGQSRFPKTIHEVLPCPAPQERFDGVLSPIERGRHQRRGTSLILPVHRHSEIEQYLDYFSVSVR